MHRLAHISNARIEACTDSVTIEDCTNAGHGRKITIVFALGLYQAEQVKTLFRLFAQRESFDEIQQIVLCDNFHACANPPTIYLAETAKAK